MNTNDIRSQLGRLTENERRRLMYAFENMISELIVFSDRTFVGCNLKFLEPLEVTASHGPWMVGKIKEKKT